MIPILAGFFENFVKKFLLTVGEKGNNIFGLDWLLRIKVFASRIRIV